MKYPSRKEAINILKRYRVPKNVIKHSLDVEKIAVAIAKQLKKSGNKVDIDLIRVSAILHDLGRWKYSRERGSDEYSYLHSYESGRILRKLGYYGLSRIVEEHFGITEDEARKLGIPNPHNMMPKRIEAKIIFIADKIRTNKASLEGILDYLRDSKTLERRYFSKCPGMKKRLLRDVKVIWKELEKMGMKF